MNNNHLMQQIQSYDKQIKEYDNQQSKQDKEVIWALTSKNANEEVLSNDELKQLFS